MTKTIIAYSPKEIINHIETHTKKITIRYEKIWVCFINVPLYSSQGLHILPKAPLVKILI